MNQISLNFGAVKDTIYRFSGRELVNEGANKQTILSSFIKSIKENPALKVQYLVFKNIEEGHFAKERLAERYINQNFKLFENISWDKIIAANREVRVKLLENAHVEGNVGKNELYENIHVLIESHTRPGYSDVEKSQEAYEHLLEYLTKEKTTLKLDESTEKNDGPSLLSWNFVTNLAVNNFNKRYAHLNETEQKLLKVLLSDEEKKKLHLTGLINENKIMIDDIFQEQVANANHDKSVTDVLSSFTKKLSKVETMVNENIDEAIINCAELNEELKEVSAK